MSLDLAKLSERQKLDLTRAYALAFIRMGEPADKNLAKRLVASLDSQYPAKGADLNRELSQLLVFLKAPSVIGKTLAMMDTKVESSMVVDREALDRNDGYGGTIKKVLANTPEIQNLHYAMSLRNLRYGWKEDQRKKYFAVVQGRRNQERRCQLRRLFKKLPEGRPGQRAGQRARRA